MPRVSDTSIRCRYELSFFCVSYYIHVPGMLLNVEEVENLSTAVCHLVRSQAPAPDGFELAMPIRMFSGDKLRRALESWVRLGRGKVFLRTIGKGQGM